MLLGCLFSFCLQGHESLLVSGPGAEKLLCFVMLLHLQLLDEGELFYGSSRESV